MDFCASDLQHLHILNYSTKWKPEYIVLRKHFISSVFFSNISNSVSSYAALIVRADVCKDWGSCRVTVCKTTNYLSLTSFFNPPQGD